jgi:hypothetical protein
MTRDEFIEKYSGKHYGDAKSLENKLAEIAGAIYDTMFKEKTPVDGAKATVTVNMTNANADPTYTAKEYGTDGNDISVTHVDPGGNSKSLVVTVDGKDITISLATDGSGTITTTCNELKAAVDAHEGASALVDIAVEGTGEGVVEAKAKASLTGGVNVTEGIIGSVAFDETNLYIKISEQTWLTLRHLI